MSLQPQSTMLLFALGCVDIWRNWLRFGNVIGRSSAFERLIGQTLGFMPVPEFGLFRAEGTRGAFIGSRSRWQLVLNQAYLTFDNVSVGDFAVICQTIYHECRHAEQRYRVAQGLASGHLLFPDKQDSDLINAIGPDAQADVRSRVALFGGGQVHGAQVQAQQKVLNANMLHEWVQIPQNVAAHAWDHRAEFADFIALTKPQWFRRHSMLAEAEDWVHAWHKATYAREILKFSQMHAMDARGRKVEWIFGMYRNLAPEVDAWGIEAAVRGVLLNNIGLEPGARRLSPPVKKLCGDK